MTKSKFKKDQSVYLKCNNRPVKVVNIVKMGKELFYYDVIDDRGCNRVNHLGESDLYI